MDLKYYLSVCWVDAGIWMVRTEYNGIGIEGYTTNKLAIHEFQEGSSDKEIKRGFNTLRKEIIKANEL